MDIVRCNTTALCPDRWLMKYLDHMIRNFVQE